MVSTETLRKRAVRKDGEARGVIMTRSRSQEGVRQDSSVTPEQHRVLAASFIWQPRPELHPEVLAQLARATSLEERQVVAWARRMRGRMNVGR